jgi:hypothetical protein
MAALEDRRVGEEIVILRVFSALPGVSESTLFETVPRIIFDHLFATACGDPRSRPFGTILRGDLAVCPKPQR